MKTSKWLVIAMAATLAVGGISVIKTHAAPAAGPLALRRGAVLARVKEKLGLTDEQTQKVYKVRADYGDQINTMKQKITQLQSEEKAELLKLLTDAQKARLKEIATADIDKKPTDDKKPEVKKSEDKKP